MTVKRSREEASLSIKCDIEGGISCSTQATKTNGRKRQRTNTSCLTIKGDTNEVRETLESTKEGTSSLAPKKFNEKEHHADSTEKDLVATDECREVKSVCGSLCASPRQDLEEDCCFFKEQSRVPTFAVDPTVPTEIELETPIIIPEMPFSASIRSIERDLRALMDEEEIFLLSNIGDDNEAMGNQGETSAPSGR